MPVNASDIKPGVVLRGRTSRGKTRKVIEIHYPAGFMARVHFEEFSKDGDLIRVNWIGGRSLLAWAASIVPAPSDATQNPKETPCP